MLKTSPYQVLTGYDLLLGHSIFWDGSNWSNHFQQSKLFTEDEQDTIPAIAEREDKAARVTGPYAIYITQEPNNTIKPLAMRERARVHGPSVDFMPKPLTNQTKAG